MSKKKVVVDYRTAELGRDRRNTSRRVKELEKEIEEVQRDLYRDGLEPQTYAHLSGQIVNKRDEIEVLKGRLRWLDSQIEMDVLRAQ